MFPWSCFALFSQGSVSSWRPDHISVLRVFISGGTRINDVTLPKTEELFQFLCIHFQKRSLYKTVCISRTYSQTIRWYHSCYQLQYVWKDLLSCYFLSIPNQSSALSPLSYKTIWSNTVIAVPAYLQDSP